MTKYWNKEYPEFNTNLSPTEMFSMGIFGGSYFFNSKIHPDPSFFINTVNPEFIDSCKKLGIDFEDKISRKIPDYSINYYYPGFCGSDYETWDSKGWITEENPYGWVNWYINFYYGERKEEDAKQIKRWKSFISRHSGMIKKYEKEGKSTKKSKQNLLHWAYHIK